MLTITHSDKEVLLSFRSLKRINILNYEFVRDTLVRILDRTGKKEIVIDLDGIYFIDSAGFGMILEVIKLSDFKDKKIFFCNISSELTELIELMKLQHLFVPYEQLYELMEY